MHCRRRCGWRIGRRGNRVVATGAQHDSDGQNRHDREPAAKKSRLVYLNHLLPDGCRNHQALHSKNRSHRSRSNTRSRASSSQNAAEPPTPASTAPGSTSHGSRSSSTSHGRADGQHEDRRDRQGHSSHIGRSPLRDRSPARNRPMTSSAAEMPRASAPAPFSGDISRCGRSIVFARNPRMYAWLEESM